MVIFMFYYLKGILAHVEPGLAVIDVGGVGYACHTSITSLSRVEVGAEATFYTYLHVREDMMDLYGFSDPEELSCFKMLIGISGVGPKAALSILSVVSPSQLALAVVSGDEKPLLAASGVGKKMAQRILLECKDKIAKEQIALASEGTISMPVMANDAAGEAAAALAVLGYSKGEIDSVLRGIDTTDMDVEEIVKKALFGLMR